VSVGDGHLPDADVAEDVREELAQGEGHDQPGVVAPRDVGRVPAHAPEVEERAGVDGDRG